MSEKQEIQIRKTVNQWQSRQAVNGNVFFFLCVASFISFAIFVADPSKGSAWLMFVSLMLMLCSGFSMLRSAHGVVQHQQLLRAPVISAPYSRASAFEVIDAEVVSPAFGLDATEPVETDAFSCQYIPRVQKRRRGF